MSGMILFALLLFTYAVQSGSSDRLNIIPSPDTACPGEFTGEPCLTLLQYVTNPSLSSNITLELNPGSHHLDAQLTATNINSLTMRATTNASVTCSQQGEFSFRDLQLVHISGITFANCKMELRSVLNVTFVRSSFLNSTYNSYTVFGIYISTVMIDQSTFENNSRGCCRDGGAIYFNTATNVNIQNCKFTGNRIYTHRSIEGGAVFVSGDLIITNTHFTGNSAGQGGAVYVNGNLIVRNTTFTDNTANTGQGGAVYVNGNITVRDTTFTANTGQGGAVYVNGNIIVHSTTFTDNTANTGQGGAVYVNGNNITVRDTTFTNNTANAGVGGAIYSARRYTNIELSGNIFSHNTAAYCGVLDVDEFHHQHVNFTANTFIHNKATGQLAGNSGGGVICIRNASISLLNNNFTHNSAVRNAGVLRVDESDVTVERSIFSNNTAGGNGGVFYTYFYPTTYTITHSTFSNNHAGGDGGVMYVGRADSQVRIHHSTLSSNSAANRGGVIAIVASTLLVNGASVFENTAELGDVVSACNSNVTISNPEMIAPQDLTQTSCSLYGDSNTAVSMATTQTTEDGILTTTASPTEEATENDIVATTASATEEETSTTEDATMASPTEKETSTTQDDIFATTASPTEETSTTEDDILATTASPTEEETSTAEDDIIATAASPTEEETSTTEDDILATAASPTEEETSTTEDDILATTASPTEETSTTEALTEEITAEDDILATTASPTDETITEDDIPTMIALKDNALGIVAYAGLAFSLVAINFSLFFFILMIIIFCFCVRLKSMAYTVKNKYV